MTISDLTHLATATLAASSIEERAAHGRALAQGVSDLLGVGFPCGWPETETVLDADGVPMVRLVDWRGFAEPDEVRGLVVDALRAADLVDAMRAVAEARAEESGDE